MNIGIFTECYKPTINGVVMSIEAFKNQLEKKGHQVFVFAPSHKQAVPLANVYRVPSITLPSPKDYPIGIPYLSYSLIRSVVFSLHLDIIHTQHIFLMGGFGQKLAKQLGIPTVHTYHTMMTEYTHYVPIKILRELSKKFIIIRSRKFCNRANIVIVPSTPVADVLRSYGVKTPIEILPTGIDLKQFKKLNTTERKNFLKKYNIPDKKCILLFVGRLAREKNLSFLLNCFGEMVKKNQNIHLVLVGSGPDEESLKKQITNLKLKSYVTLTGFLPKTETNKFFGASDIFVFPSTTDTQGIVLAESLASSLPAVAIDKLGPKDIIQNGKDGYLVPEDPKEFIAKTLKLINDKNLRIKLGTNAKKNVERFSIENCAEKLINIYNDLKNLNHPIAKT